MKFKTIDRKVVDSTKTEEMTTVIALTLDSEGYDVVSVSFYVNPMYPGTLRIAVLGVRK